MADTFLEESTAHRHQLCKRATARLHTKGSDQPTFVGYSLSQAGALSPPCFIPRSIRTQYRTKRIPIQALGSQNFRSSGAKSGASAGFPRPFCPVPHRVRDSATERSFRAGNEATAGKELASGAASESARRTKHERVRRPYECGSRTGGRQEAGVVPGRGGGAVKAGSSRWVRAVSSGCTAWSGSRSASSASSVHADSA